MADQMVILSRGGQVHRYPGSGGLTACKLPVTAGRAAIVTDKQVEVHGLARCAECWPTPQRKAALHRYRPPQPPWRETGLGAAPQ